MNNESQTKPEKLSDVSNEFTTRIPKALVDRAEEQKEETQMSSLELPVQALSVNDGIKNDDKEPARDQEAKLNSSIQFSPPPLHKSIARKRTPQSSHPRVFSSRSVAHKKDTTFITRPPANLTRQAHAPAAVYPPSVITNIDTKSQKQAEQSAVGLTPKSELNIAVLPKAIKERGERLHLEQAAAGQNREIRIDLSASRSLTHLICALAINPGLGSEVSVDDRREGIQNLIAKSHELADFICKKIKNNGDVPDYLYGSIFQDATRHVATIWTSKESLDITAAQKIAAEIFNHENPLLNQFTYDAASQNTRYQLEGSERAELELQSALMGAMGRLRTTVLSMKVGGFIEGYGEQVETLREHYAEKPYLFGQDDDSKIVTDLTEISIRIAEKNKINAIDEGMATQWNVSMIYRAADLVKSEYEMFVERLIRASFSDLALHEQALNGNNDMYQVGLRNVEKRAEESFNMISKTARRLALAPTPVQGDDSQGDIETERDKP